MTSIPSLESITLDKGSHSNRDDGMCIMEAVSWIAGEPWSDRPKCASPVVATFLLNWNDALPDDTRQSLRQYILPLIGSRGTDEQELRRSWMACDWLVRTFTVRWLRLAKLEEHAVALESLPELTTAASANAALPIITAAWVAAGAAAGAAARAAAWDAAWAAAWVAAGAAAGDAAWVAAGAAARDAARDAAGDALAPTVRDLQESAHALVRRMLEVTP